MRIPGLLLLLLGISGPVAIAQEYNQPLDEVGIQGEYGNDRDGRSDSVVRTLLGQSSIPDVGITGGNPFENLPPGMTPQEAQRRLKLRRKMMNVHQALSLATWGILTANQVFGTLNYIPRLNPRVKNANNAAFFNDVVPTVHRITAYGGSGFYLTTGIIGWTAPKPIDRQTGPLVTIDDEGERKIDSGRLHRRLSYVHAAGMGIMVLNGLLNRYAFSGNQAYPATITTHLALGYATYALVTIAGAYILFK